MRELQMIVEIFLWKTTSLNANALVAELLLNFYITYVFERVFIFKISISISDAAISQAKDEKLTDTFSVTNPPQEADIR